MPRAQTSKRDKSHGIALGCIIMMLVKNGVQNMVKIIHLQLIRESISVRSFTVSSRHSRHCAMRQLFIKTT